MSKKKRTSKKKQSKLIKPRGMGLAIKLYRHSGLTETPTKLAKALRDIEYKPSKKNDITSGFTKATAKGKTVEGEFVAGFRVPVLTYSADGDLTAQHYVSVDRAHVFIKMDRGTIEIRGSDRVARRFLKTLEDATGATTSPLNLNGGTKVLYDSAKDISSVLLTGVEKGNLSKAQFQGEGIQTEEEIGLYTRRYKGEITRFRGKFGYPSGAILTTAVNAEVGSLVVFRSGDGILEKDVDWIVGMMEDAAV